ncbi:uncharacterized protein LOC110065550 [Orbicella faveolata]|uniref:uncharacterized protein LOC110041013 n=1 Tax=Orbicella faveolata TaxID=48498 RepID=UPI0009E2AB99|nr:uncharacterized protein LOC110041013 [Orbicella faveolata]XP_020628359.1 uncharacterized protein LOC110065550 [Orbicella faveolata]
MKFFNNIVAARRDPRRSPRILSSFPESIPISDFKMATHPQCRLGKEKANMAYRDEIDDAFDAAVFLEERCYESGYKEGYKDGKLKGLQEGRHLGLMKGCEVGGEVGFYLGFVSMWHEILLESPDAKQRYHVDY